MKSAFNKASMESFRPVEPSLFSTIEVFVKLENIVTSSGTLKTSWDLHLDVNINVSLGVGKGHIDSMKMKVENGRNG